jgi:hypothetical protein
MNKERGFTMYERAIADSEQMTSGRFAAETKQRIVGTTETPNYPAAPKWAEDLSGIERPLGFPIDQQEPVGTEAEVLKSLEEVEALDGVNPSPAPSSIEPSSSAPTKSNRGRTE